MQCTSLALKHTPHRTLLRALSSLLAQFLPTHVVRIPRRCPPTSCQSVARSCLTPCLRRPRLLWQPYSRSPAWRTTPALTAGGALGGCAATRQEAANLLLNSTCWQAAMQRPAFSHVVRPSGLPHAGTPPGPQLCAARPLGPLQKRCHSSQSPRPLSWPAPGSLPLRTCLADGRWLARARTCTTQTLGSTQVSYQKLQV